ncbi:MAG TPA: hypothetical protein VK593_08535, partial [Edaphobacter sp.]|nr:hypothetical protein [Edaphobacter sp.]
KYSGWFILSASIAPEIKERIQRNILSLELGELAYQLRAALDGLIWDAVTYSQGSEPPSNEANGLEFPILNGKKRGFKQCGLHKFPFPQKLKDWLESIQPDATEKAIGDPHRGLKATLEDIHNLARMDRHRRLRVIAAVPVLAKLVIETDPPGGIISDRIFSPCDLLSGQDEIARIRVECAGGLVPYNVRLKAQVAFDISVEDVELYDGKNISFQLERFLQAVMRVTERFSEEFP